MDTLLLLDPVLWKKIVFAIFCGAMVGIERQRQKKPIDVRTSVLICLGTMVFIHLGGLLGGQQDPTRVLGQVVTGIGFLGAGAIITRQGLVIGLTSAAVVWVLAAIGAAIGFGYYETGIAVSVVTVLILLCLHGLEQFFKQR